ncbi:hypothetical protein GON26_20405 [Flavobacterium sp. GA093]|uniref:Uncharacterized protein n=1 Tax=Flavobacterium hydrocarbonoxydans TaxID=2683249 RepID=A0A6I4NUG8_9FLAO|nr:hypothetical protein [Flavobacterium hydrocarbonoxydans]MWB96732.1 hypothetical protein [Flavobacterium hydrocarbonoxydans]
MPLPELNLSLGLTDNDGSVFYSGHGEGKVIVRTDSALRHHTITITISEQEVGTVNLNTHNKSDEAPSVISIPTYQMLVTDDKTNETEVYKVTRDTFVFKEQKTKKGLWSFLGLTFLSPKNFLFENIPFEPLHQELETFDISKYRKLNVEELTYTFQKDRQTIQLFAGDINTLEIQKDVSYFVIVDEKKGQRFIGDILYREKMLKLTPKVKLQVVKRKKVSKAIETNKDGKIDKLIYL